MKNNKILSYSQLLSKIKRLKQQQKTIVFAHGVFDLLHRGHLTLLLEAKKQGDVLIVGVEPDDNTRIIKGPNRPIHHQDARIFMISQLIPVNYTFLIPSYPPHVEQNNFYHQLYLEIKPDIVATCIKAGKHGLLKKQHAYVVKAKFIDIDSIYELNTTKVLELLKASLTNG